MRSGEAGEMANLINEIYDNTKLAREQALMGNYEMSVVYYQGVVQQIHRLLVQVREPGRRERWLQVSHKSQPRFLFPTM